MNFYYQVDDGVEPSSRVRVDITVIAVPDAPEGVPDFYVGQADTLLSVPKPAGVLANDSDAENDPITAVLVSGPTHGTLLEFPLRRTLRLPARSGLRRVGHLHVPRHRWRALFAARCGDDRRPVGNRAQFRNRSRRESRPAAQGPPGRAA